VLSKKASERAKKEESTQEMGRLLFEKQAYHG
jgi:hypothetical protein